MTHLSLAGRLALVSIGCIACAAGALAQSEAPGVGPQQSAGASGPGDPSVPSADAAAVNQSSGEIIVTAQRRSERSRDVPVSITAIGAAQLDQAGIKQLSDIGRVTPGLRFDNVGTFVQPTIRGIGTSFATSGGIGNVGIYVDGFYAPNPLASDFQLLNVENIQVLKGPQGTLFGRNTTGGAILVTTARPSTETSATIEASYGSFDAKRVQAYATTGIGGGVAIDIEGLYRDGDGFQRDLVSGRRDVGGYRNWSVRTGIAAAIGSLSLLARYQHLDNDDPSAQLGNAYVAGGTALTAAVQPAIQQLFGAPTVATRPSDVALSAPVSFRARSDVFQLTAGFDLGGATITSYTQYRRDQSLGDSDLDFTTTPLFFYRLPVHNKTFTQELLATSKPGSRLQWTAGLFYITYVDHYGPVLGSAFGAPLAPFAESSTTSSSAAGYVDLTYQMTDRLFLTAGARYSHDEVRDAYFSQALPNGALSRINVPSLKSDRVTPRAVVRFKPDERSSVYASYTRGYKPGLLNVGGASLDGLRVAPEKISAWEVGYKYGTSRFSLDLAAFTYNYRDLQVSSYNGTQSLLTNAATARIRGLEAQARVTPLPGLELNGGAAYTDGKYRNFATAPFYDFSTPFLFAIVTRPGGASGFQMQRTPKITANFGAQYTLDLARGKLRLSGNLFHTSAVSFDAAGQFRQPGYETLGLRAAWTDPSDRFTLAVFGDNITDARYRLQGLPSVFGVGNTWSYPATIGASFRVAI